MVTELQKNLQGAETRLLRAEEARDALAAELHTERRGRTLLDALSQVSVGTDFRAAEKYHKVDQKCLTTSSSKLWSVLEKASV